MDAAETAEYLARWQPSRQVSAQAAGFARQVVAGCGPLESEVRARALLWSAHRLASWGMTAGLELVPGVLLHPSVIERFTAWGPGLSDASRRSLRTNLRFIGRQVAAHLHPGDKPLPRGRAAPPYTPGEIAGFLALADAQPTPARRHHAAALVCLGAGTGLIRSDLRSARGTSVHARSGGVVVEVAGTRPRVVPVLAAYHARLLAAAEYAGEQFLTGGTWPGRRNLTNPLTRSLAGGTGLPALDTSRLRSTWLAEAAALIGLPAFMAAAGISCCQRLGDITAGLDPGSEAAAVALLTGPPG